MNVEQIRTAILLLPHAEFGEDTALALIEAMKARLEVCSFRHMEHAINAIESLEDAATVLQVAREDMLDEVQE